MNKPNAAQRNSNPEYLRSLIERAGLTQREAARKIGISSRLLRYYIAPEDSPNRRDAPYPIQFALEQLAQR